MDSLILGFSVILFILFACFTPVWYDDACHSLAILGITQTGKEFFPIGKDSYFPHSLLITVGPIWNYLVSVWAIIGNWNVYILRIPNLLISIAFILLVYRTTNSIFKNRGIYVVLLIISNLQILTYGPQMLGEIPALFFVWLSCYTLVLWQKNNSNRNLIYAVLFANTAILCKEYIALPIGLTFVGLFFQIESKQRLNFILAGLALVIGSILYYAIKFQDFSQWLAFWQLKKNYSQEFFSFSLEPIRFLVYKPLIILGLLAAWVRVLLTPSKVILPIFLFFNLHTLFFLMSIGYDRFAVFLVPFAAFFLSDWIRFLWIRAQSLYLKALFIVLFGILFVQNTPFKLYSLVTTPTNISEKEIVQFIQTQPKKSFSFELPIVAFAPQVIETSGYPPCLQSLQKPISIIPNTYYILGPYSDTEFIGKIDENHLMIVFRNQDYRIGIKR